MHLLPFGLDINCLIMANELIYFDDQYYKRAKRFVINTITEEEYRLYKDGKLRKIYDSFEYLLLDNIQYYNRIIRTIILLYDNMIIDHGKVIDFANRGQYKRPMTPTKFYYLIMCNIDFSRDEIIFAYDTLKDYPGNSFKDLYKYLKDITAFNFNLSFTASLQNVKSYTKLLANDTTDEKYLDKITSNINNEAVYITSEDLEKSIEGTLATFENMCEVYELLKLDITDSETVIDVQPTKITVFNKESEMLCEFKDGILVRRSVRNFRGCFEWDAIISKYLSAIYSWVLKSVDYENRLIDLIEYLVLNNRKRFKAIRQSPDKRIFATLEVKKSWNHYFLYEAIYVNGILVRKTRTSVKGDYVAKEIYKRGYWVFGYEDFDMLQCKFGNLSDTTMLQQYYLDFVYNSQITIDKLLFEMQTNLLDTCTHLDKIYRI